MAADRSIKLVTFSSKVEEHFRNYPAETKALRDDVTFVPNSATGMVHACCFTQHGMKALLRKNVDRWLRGASNFIVALTSDAAMAQMFVSDFKGQTGNAWRVHRCTFYEWQEGQSGNKEAQWQKGQSGNEKTQRHKVQSPSSTVELFCSSSSSS